MFVFSLHSAKNREEKPTETSEDWKMFTGPFVHQSYFILCKNEQNILLPWRKENTCPGYEIRPDSILATERDKELSHFYHVNRRKQESKQMLNLLNLIWVCFSSSAFFFFSFCTFLPWFCLFEIWILLFFKRHLPHFVMQIAVSILFTPEDGTDM